MILRRRKHRKRPRQRLSGLFSIQMDILRIIQMQSICWRPEIFQRSAIWVFQNEIRRGACPVKMREIHRVQHCSRRDRFPIRRMRLRFRLIPRNCSDAGRKIITEMIRNRISMMERKAGSFRTGMRRKTPMEVPGEETETDRPIRGLPEEVPEEGIKKIRKKTAQPVLH